MNKTYALLFISLASLAACGSTTVKVDDGKVLEVQKYNTVIQGSKDPVHGTQVGFKYGAIDGVGQTHANGVAYFPTFDDGNSVLTVNVNILLAPKGSHYLAMLTDGTSKGLMEVGTLQSIVGDVRHSVKLETKADVTNFNTVLVYLVKDSGSGNETLVAKGTLKKVQK